LEALDYCNTLISELETAKERKVALRDRKTGRKAGRPKLSKGDVKPRIVPVRFKASDFIHITAAAKKRNQAPSKWIRFAIKKALKQLDVRVQGGSTTMKGTESTTYEQQIESGKEIVRGMLAGLAAEMNEPKLNDLSFQVTDQDFDYDRISLVDREKLSVVVKIKEDDLADCPADASVRRLLEGQLRKAINSYRVAKL
jgi:hypothetical protein